MIEQEFWEKAYQNNIGNLIGACYRYTRNHPLSEDLAHDAFLKAIDKYGTFEGKGKFEAWLRRIVVNHTLQYLRDRKKDLYLDDLPPAQEPPDPIEENWDPIASMTFTTDELINTIDQLPDHHRLVFNLYVLEQFTHAQIGAELGISEGTSKSHLARARKKLKQLLVQKAAAPRPAKENKKAFVLLLAANAEENMDEMFRNCLDDYSIPPQHPLSLQSPPFKDQHKFGRSTVLKTTIKILAIPAILSIIVAIVWVAGKKDKPEPSPSVIQNTASDSAEKKTASFPSPAATISQNSVIPERNLKQKQMKPLDSLALMLALSTGTLNTEISKDSMKQEIEKYSEVDTVPARDTAVESLPVNYVSTLPEVKKARGVFRASELHWSEKDNEVYFKGKVVVNFREQRFHGNGSFTFLGKVALLIVDGQQATLGKVVKLADDDYELITLNSKQATEKYADKGIAGAVEIARKQ